jgi:hypothetical protein
VHCYGRSAHNLAKKLGVDAPIIEGIYRVIHEGADPKAVCIEVRTNTTLFTDSTHLAGCCMEVAAAQYTSKIHTCHHVVLKERSCTLGVMLSILAHPQVMSRELRPEVDEVTFAAAAVPPGQQVH